MGLPTLPFMTNLSSRTDRARSQLVFLDFVIVPLWQAVEAAFPEVFSLTAALPTNRARYAAIAQGASDGEVLRDAAWPPAFHDCVFGDSGLIR